MDKKEIARIIYEKLIERDVRIVGIEEIDSFVCIAGGSVSNLIINYFYPESEAPVNDIDIYFHENDIDNVFHKLKFQPEYNDTNDDDYKDSSYTETYGMFNLLVTRSSKAIDVINKFDINATASALIIRDGEPEIVMNDSFREFLERRVLRFQLIPERFVSLYRIMKKHNEIKGSTYSITEAESIISSIKPHLSDYQFNKYGKYISRNDVFSVNGVNIINTDNFTKKYIYNNDVKLFYRLNELQRNISYLLVSNVRLLNLLTAKFICADSYNYSNIVGLISFLNEHRSFYNSLKEHVAIRRYTLNELYGFVKEIASYKHPEYSIDTMIRYFNGANVILQMKYIRNPKLFISSINNTKNVIVW